MFVDPETGLVVDSRGNVYSPKELKRGGRIDDQHNDHDDGEWAEWLNG